MELSTPPAITHATRQWAAVTIQVAWTLLRQGIRPNGPALADARDHVLGSLPDGIPDDRLDGLAATLTRDFLVRARTGRYRVGLPPEEPAPATAQWREDLLTVLDPIGVIVFRMVYGDGHSLEEVEHRRGIDRVILGGSQEGLRSAVRVMLRGHGVSHTTWDSAWVDRVLRRLAEVPGRGCTDAPGNTGNEDSHCVAPGSPLLDPFA